MEQQKLNIDFMPLIDSNLLIALVIITAVLALIAFVKYRAEITLYRILAVGILILCLANPVITERQQERIKDLVVIAQDLSASNQINNRDNETASAVESLQALANQNEYIDYKLIDLSSKTSKDTKITPDWLGALSPSELKRLSASFIVTDGLLHDADTFVKRHEKHGPINVILSGQKDEIDRVIKIEKAPAYGIVGQNVSFTVFITDEKSNDLNNINSNEAVPLQILSGSDVIFDQEIALNEPINVTLPIKNAGDNFFTLSTDIIEDELTGINNKRILNIQGVRDRLRVLLVSGLPHNGARVWRNLLKSDVNIDLVHFTILRTPEKVNLVPVTELALIPFPVQELFIDKINDFDLIIFDRFSKYGMLPIDYMKSIANYVKKGGAFLDVAGPDNFGRVVIETELDRIMPLKLKSETIDQAFLPKLTDIGTRHSITETLVTNNNNEPNWSPWARQMALDRLRSDNAVTLMNGINGMPLLAIDEVENGRVAQLSSDQIWIWARDPEKGGPHKELLRRLSHWLMKEPQLEDNKIRMSQDENKIEITVEDSVVGSQILEITKPNNEVINLDIMIEQNGIGRVALETNEFGVYTVKARKSTKSFAIGPFNDLEFETLVRNDKKLETALSEHPHKIIDHSALSTISRIRSAKVDALNYPRSNEFLIEDKNQFKTLALSSRPLLPPVLMLLFSVLFIVLSWYKESNT